MTKYGHQNSWQYAMEDSAETPTSSVAFKLPGIVTSAPSESKFSVKQYRGLKQPSATDQRAQDIIVPSKNEYSFSLTYIPMKRMAGDTYPKYDFRHFHNCVMNNSSSTAAGGAWTYGTSVTTNLRSFTVFKETDNIQKQINGCKISRLTARCSVDNPVEITVEGIGSAATYANLAHTDATTLRNGTPFMWSDVSIYLDGSLATYCTAFEYAVSNNAGSDHTLGDRDPKSVTLKGRDVDVSITRQFNDTGEFNAAKNGTAKSVTIVLDDGTDVNIGFRECKYDGVPYPGENEDVLTHVLRLKAKAMFTN